MVETGELLDVAREAAFAAGRRVMEVLRSTVETARKADHSLVTNADHEANTVILTALRRSFPEHGILSEETGREGPVSAEYVWVVDPLDGTRAFVRGLAGFSVHVGLLKEGRPHAGVVFDPASGEHRPAKDLGPDVLIVHALHDGTILVLAGGKHATIRVLEE